MVDSPVTVSYEDRPVDLAAQHEYDAEAQAAARRAVDTPPAWWPTWRVGLTATAVGAGAVAVLQHVPGLT